MREPYRYSYTREPGRFPLQVIFVSDLPVVIVGSFLIAFKAVLLEGSEVAILSIATVTQLGKKNVLAGGLIGSLVSVFTFLVVRQVFVLLPYLLIDFVTGAVLLYFSSRFLRVLRGLLR